ncbi:hypothetical protein BDW22DRAFT_1362884 [Trametopsis cervina]|nr:hypothetical protein BDW22DRAFT_1362884 [Trametopsis cervina]
MSKVTHVDSPRQLRPLVDSLYRPSYQTVSTYRVCSSWAFYRRVPNCNLLRSCIQGTQESR